VPCEDRVGRHDRCDLGKQLATECLAKPSQSHPLVVGQANAPLPELSLQDAVLRDEVLDDALLVAVHPAGVECEEEYEGLWRWVHRSCDGTGPGQKSLCFMAFENSDLTGSLMKACSVSLIGGTTVVGSVPGIEMDPAPAEVVPSGKSGIGPVIAGKSGATSKSHPKPT